METLAVSFLVFQVLVPNSLPGLGHIMPSTWEVVYTSYPLKDLMSGFAWLDSRSFLFRCLFHYCTRPSS